jgi:hypothetical protein
MAIFWALFSLLVGYLFDLYNGDASLPNNNSPRINPTVVELADEFQEMQTRTAELEAFNNMIPTPRR